jgi:amidase
MKRRKFIQASTTAGVSITILGIYSCKNDSPSSRADENSVFALNEITIDELQKKMEDGTYTSRSITELYLKQIEVLDKNGPMLNSIIELNPDALTLAEEVPCMAYRY